MTKLFTINIQIIENGFLIEIHKENHLLKYYFKNEKEASDFIKKYLKSIKQENK